MNMADEIFNVLHIAGSERAAQAAFDRERHAREKRGYAGRLREVLRLYPDIPEAARLRLKAIVEDLER